MICLNILLATTFSEMKIEPSSPQAISHKFHRGITVKGS
jgi:hypothetical protein